MKYMNTFIYYCMFKFPTFDERHKKKICFFKKREVECKSAKDAYFCLLLQLGTHSHIGLHLWDTESHREKTSRCCCCYSYWLVSELKKSGLEVIFALLIAPLVKFIFFPRISSFFCQVSVHLLFSTENVSQFFFQIHFYCWPEIES